MAPFQRYPAYKDSGVEWFGNIPDGWEVKMLKYIKRLQGGYALKSDNYKDNGIPVVRIGDIKNNILWDACKKHPKHDSITDEFVIKKNDTLIALSGATTGKSCFIDNCPPLSYLNQRVAKFNYRNKFLFYNVVSAFFQKQIILTANGSAQENISNQQIEKIIIPIPPLPEQTAIANFLDKKCSNIDRAVAQKEKLVELLKERKQIVIQNAVTKGLNPNAKMKDSGVVWIGDIPEHWEVMKCKYLFYETDERSLEGKEELLSVSHMTGVTPRSEKDVNMFLAENYAGSKLCQEGDLIYNIMWAWMGALGVSKQEGIVSPSYGVYRQKHHDNFNPSYIEELLKSNKYIEHYNRVSTGLHSSRLRFYSHMFFSMKIGFPKKNEQDKIVNHIEKESIKIDTAVTLQQKQIKKLKEYKATLINSAVTGKIKVC